jgi:hypothetical protein
MPLSVTELHTVLHDRFHDTADDLARDSGFCQRQRALTGSVFAQTLVFSLLDKVQPTRDDFADFAAQHLGVPVTPNAFDQRFHPAAVDFLRQLLAAAFDRAFDSVRPALLPVLRHFAGVYVRDASLRRLPAGLADVFPARPAGAGAPTAALKLVLELEVTTGAFTELDLLPAVDNEKTSPVAAKPLPAGALLLEDMGFLCGQRLQTYIDQGVYVLTRVPHWTAFFESRRGRRGLVRLDVRRWLRRASGHCLERPVFIFHHEKVAVRLLAIRVPEAITQQRRLQVRADAKRRGRPVSQAKLELCAWTILVTNAPAALLNGYNAWDVRRVRWQIELVFKAFKSVGGLERTGARSRNRLLGEGYAKLLGLVVQQWCLLSAGYVLLRHSLSRASRRLRSRAGTVVETLGDGPAFARQIEALGRELARCGIDRRQRSRSTLARLAARDYEFRQLDIAA